MCNMADIDASRTPAGYGPWSPALSDATERKAQLRSMAALALVYLGPDHRLVTELRAAEVDATALARAQRLVEELPALVRRKLLSRTNPTTSNSPPPTVTMMPARVVPAREHLGTIAPNRATKEGNK